MQNHEVRRPLYTGSQMVRALWFDLVLLGEPEAQRRLLALWEHGARAWRLHGGFLLEWKQARRLQCERAPGLPLVEQDGVLASAPLLAGERAGIALGSAVLVLGAGVHAEALGPSLRIDPSAWLDLAALPLCVALAMPPAPGAGFVAGIPEAAADVRALLGDAVPPLSPKRAEFLREAQRAGSAGGFGGGMGLGTLGRLLGAGALIAAVAGGGTVGLLALLPRLFLPGIGGAAGSAPARPSGPASSALRDWFAERFARLAILTRVSRLLGLRQAAYLRKMLRQFEEGNIDEALRHAIPLDSAGASSRPAFGVPGRRATLDVRGPGGAGASIGLDDQLMRYLRDTYQRSFEMLDRAGRIDEAVYVLAELMNRRQEAVDYLERKGRLAQAAQLAETLELPSAVIVRLYCMAGDLARAVLLARLTDSFAGAVAELERRHHAEAGALRLEWAQSLAARGNLIEAVTALWPLEQERDRARAWLQQAEQAGGSLGVQGLVYTLVLDPQARQARRDAVQDLLYAEGEDAARERMRARDCLAGLDKHNATTHHLAAELWRRLLLDRAAGLNTITQDALSALRTRSADPVLDADLPKDGLPAGPSRTALRARNTPLRLRLHDRGLLPIEDALRLPDGDFLLALGEAGVVLADAQGKERTRFPVPAHHLVGARNGRHALALARREKTVRVSRIDLLQRKAGDWFSAPLAFWSSQYDGDSWSVVAQERLMALDTAAPGQSVLWQVKDLPGRIVAFDEQDGMQAILLEVDGGVEQWRYALPERRLRQRERFAIQPGKLFAVLPDCHREQPAQLTLEASGDGSGGMAFVLPSGRHGKGGSFDLSHTKAKPRVSLHEDLVLLQFEGEDGWYCQLVDLPGRLLAEIELPGAVGAQASVVGKMLLAWDRCGRIVELDMTDCAVRIVTVQ